ncbi:MAG: hybrid sensor histidine kinase/response regulator [Rhodospirillales bacterium]|nr:hybrid sensor histidine kinase/response regulator [Rhodospirillales bacterium]
MGQRLDSMHVNTSDAIGSILLGGTPLHQTKVLIVDDEPDIVEEVVEQLEEEGIECLSAHNAQRAIELVISDPDIGIVITDIRMPGMDGLEMAGHLKANLNKGRDLFVIVVTGHAGIKEAIEALKIGAEDFLTKPVSPDHLLHSVRRAEEMIQLRQNERHFQERLEREVKAKTAELNETILKLATAERIKDQFMSTMGHELRTPLNAINGFAEFLKDKLKGEKDESIGEYLEYIMLSGRRLENSIENILEFSAAVSGSRKAQMEPQVLEDLFRNISRQLHEQATEKNIELRIAPLPMDQIFEADSHMLIRAMICLANNAIKFSPENSIVTFTAKRLADGMAISIEDHGCGMNEDEIAVAKQPLTQLNGTLTRPAEGTGIGLSLAILLVELQGGNLEINSTPGEGTTVVITMPAS